MSMRTWVRAWVRPAADVVQPAVVAQGHGAGVVDPVPADPFMRIGARTSWGCLGTGGVGRSWSAPVQGAVRTGGVVVLAEAVEQGLQLGGGGRLDRLDRLGTEPFLQRLVESLHLAAGLGVVRGGVLLHDAQAVEFGLGAVAAALASGEPGGEDHPIVRETLAGMPYAATISVKVLTTAAPVTRRNAVQASSSREW